MTSARIAELMEDNRRLRQELSLAEEGLANATQELENAKHDIERLMAAASAEANEVERLRRQNERLAAALFRHACYCGCGSPEPGLHREDCAYRVACTPGAQL